MCVGSCTFAILLCFTLLDSHTAHTHVLKLLDVHSCKSYWFFFLFISHWINTCPGQCMWTHSWKSGNKPSDVFFSWFSQEKKTLIGYSCWEHGLASAPLFSLECAITFNSSNCLLIKSCFTDQHRVLAYKWLVYHPLCSFSIYWWYAVVYECNY